MLSVLHRFFLLFVMKNVTLVIQNDYMLLTVLLFMINIKFTPPNIWNKNLISRFFYLQLYIELYMKSFKSSLNTKAIEILRII